MIRHSVHTSQIIHVLKKLKLIWHILRTVEERANFLDDAHESTLCWSGGEFKRVFFFKKKHQITLRCQQPSSVPIRKKVGG